jgi:3-isopropylmalate/(R)-2-methylmalate dehydratase small subunit
MIVQGKVHKYGDNVDTDVIIPARHLNIIDHKELAKFAMQDIDASFANNVRQGDIIVAGNNFGCGSSREHAPIVIKESGISCVIAKSFARIFFRNAINIGLSILESAEAVEAIENGDEVKIDFDKGEICVNNKVFNVAPYPEFLQNIIKAGGLLNAIKNRSN